MGVRHAAEDFSGEINSKGEWEEGLEVVGFKDELVAKSSIGWLTMR